MNLSGRATASRLRDGTPPTNENRDRTRLAHTIRAVAFCVRGEHFDGELTGELAVAEAMGIPTFYFGDRRRRASLIDELVAKGLLERIPPRHDEGDRDE